MADVNISKYTTQVVRDGSKPASPGYIVSEGQDPVNPPGTNNYVPYSGATDDVQLGEFGLETGYVKLDTTPTNTPADQGTIYWDDAKSTAALIMNGTLQHIGQDIFFYVKNSTGSSIPKGTAVRFNGTDGASGHLLIAPFLANGTYPSSYFVGVTAETIANGSFGQVMHFGELSGINTSGFTSGALLYASTTVAGGFQTTAPVAPNNIVLIAAAINSTNNGTILVRPTYGSNINQDEGVKITSVADKDLLQYQSGTGLWENKTLAQVIGTAYVPSTRTITINGTTQDLSANRTYNVGTVTSVGLSSATSGVTIGSTPVTTSGTITIAIATASGSQNGLLSSTDWTTFNNKQNALTNPVTGTGTTNYLPKFTGSTTIGNSIVSESSGVINIAGRLNVLSTYASDSAAQSVLRDNTGVALNFGGTASGFKWLQAQDSAGASTYYPILINPYGGNLLVGTTTDAGYKLQVNGEGRFYQPATSSTAYLRVENNRSRNAALRLTTTVGDYLLGVGVGADVNQFQIYDNAAGATRLTISSTGAATFSSSVTAGGAISTSGTGLNASVRINNTTASTGVDWHLYSLNNGNFGIFNNTAGAYALQLTSGGNVWIGNDTNPILEIANGGSTDVLSGIRWSVGGSRVDYGGIYSATSSANNNYISFYTKNSASAPSERMRITSGGNVGIGTPSPSWMLEINKDTTSGITGGYPALSVNNPNANGYAALYFYQGTTQKAGLEYFNGNNSLIIYSNSATRLTITSGGNVLIGTTTDAGDKLQVNGAIKTSAPSGGTAGSWKFGTASSGSFSVGGRVRIEINGVAYDLLTT